MFSSLDLRSKAAYVLYYLTVPHFGYKCQACQVRVTLETKMYFYKAHVLNFRHETRTSRSYL